MSRTNPKPTTRSGGRWTVNYRHVDGTMMDAIVTGGIGTSLDLRVPSLPQAARNKTAVPKMTASNQTNVWTSRI